MDALPPFEATQPIETQAAPTAPTQAQPVSAAPAEALPSFDQTQPVDIAAEDAETPKSEFGSMGQQALAGIEAVGRGATFGMSDVAAKYLRKGAEALGINPDLAAPAPDVIKAREEENPITSTVGNVVGGALGLGTATAALKLPKYTSLGALAIKNGIEGGIITGGDEISKAMLGQKDGDPEAAVSSAIAHVGAGILFGAVLGTSVEKGLQGISKAARAIKGSQFMADLSNQWKFNVENPNLNEAIHNELDHFYNTTRNAVDETYGVNGLKDQAIKKLVPEMHEGIVKQNQTIMDTLQSKIKDMVKNTDTYPTRLTSKFMDLSNKWMETATNPSATSYEMFNATQKLKQELQAYSKFDKAYKALDPERGFIDAAKDTAFNIRSHLEDPKVWGKAGDLQKGVNKAFSKFGGKNSPLSDFERTFTRKIEGEPVLDPGKTNTYVNQLGKPSAEIKQAQVKNFVKAAEAFRDEVARLHYELGVENSMEPSSLNAVKRTLEQQTKGAKAADFLQKVGMPHVFGTVPGKAAAATVGSVIGGPVGGLIGYSLADPFSDAMEEVIDGPASRAVNKYMTPATLRAMSDSEATIAGIDAAQDYAKTVGNGAQKIENAVNSIFKPGIQQLPKPVTDKDRERLKQYVEDGDYNIDMQNEAAKADPNGVPQAFAKGGEVKKRPVQSPMDDNHLAKHFPDQSMMIAAAKARVNGYLNSVRPNQVQTRAPFDTKMKDPAGERTYNKAIDYAIQPLSIVNRIKDGSLTMEDMKHFNSMYPELYNHLSKKITAKIAEQQTEDKRPSYKLRHSLSLFLGAPVDSTFNPQHIMAAQAVFAPKSAPNAPQSQGQTKKNTSKLGKSNKDYRTPGQAAEAQDSERKS